MFLTANAEGLPIHDPDGVGGPPLFRLSAILSIFMVLDVLPRALWRTYKRLGGFPAQLRSVVRERWTGRRLAYVLVGLLSFYVVYVAYRNFKGFLPFLSPGIHDTSLLELDRAMFFGQDPATLLHSLLGTGVANEFLSFAYVIYLAFVPISLAAALVWFGDTRKGLWYAVALCSELGARGRQLLHDPLDGAGVRRAGAVRGSRPHLLVIAAARAVGGTAQRPLRLGAVPQGRRAEHRGIRVAACVGRVDGCTGRAPAARQPLAAAGPVDLLLDHRRRDDLPGLALRHRRRRGRGDRLPRRRPRRARHRPPPAPGAGARGPAGRRRHAVTVGDGVRRAAQRPQRAVVRAHPARSRGGGDRDRAPRGLADRRRAVRADRADGRRRRPPRALARPRSRRSASCSTRWPTSCSCSARWPPCSPSTASIGGWWR